MIQATRTRYIIQPVEQTLQTPSGIFVGSSNDSQFARIVAVGPAVIDPVSVGTTVVIDWRYTSKITHHNQTYYVVEADNVIAEVV